MSLFNFKFLGKAEKAWLDLWWWAEILYRLYCKLVWNSQFVNPLLYILIKTKEKVKPWNAFHNIDVCTKKHATELKRSLDKSKLFLSSQVQPSTWGIFRTFLFFEKNLYGRVYGMTILMYLLYAIALIITASQCEPVQIIT